ncbi:GNAT family protein [Amaricoccus sp.]|uniref:GNAT family N-acetyltransferase n=1 Tax=Amaricoccus sp. TaxID=1872485 RepID=UPI001B629F12|nr:GNAT family protein [Amaricoccus sp.]MBP7002827.1 GNAT family N-acetyltransferase [Amaricoccus sp.]
MDRDLAAWTPRQAPGPMTLDGRHVRLEPLAAAHAAALHAANAADDAIWDWMSYGPFADAADYAAWVDAVAGKPDPRFFAAIDRAAGRPAGVASLMRIDQAMGVIEVGHICYAPSLQRTPAATEAISLLAGWAFAAGYRRFEWKCDARNLPSRRAAARRGFAWEGVFRQAAIVKGRNRDTAWFALIDRDWPEIAAAHAAWLAPENFDAEGRQRRRLGDLTAPVRRRAEAEHPRP